MLTQKLLAAVSLAGALLAGATSDASADPWRGPYFRPGVVVRAPMVRPVYAAPIVRPVYATPVYSAPVYTAPAYAPAYGVPVVVRPPVFGWRPAFRPHIWGRRF